MALQLFERRALGAAGGGPAARRPAAGQAQTLVTPFASMSSGLPLPDAASSCTSTALAIAAAPAGYSAPTRRHERRRLLVAAQHHLNLVRLAQDLHDPVYLGARDDIDPPHALRGAGLAQLQGGTRAWVGAACGPRPRLTPLQPATGQDSRIAARSTHLGDKIGHQHMGAGARLAQVGELIVRHSLCGSCLCLDG